MFKSVATAILFASASLLALPNIATAWDEASPSESIIIWSVVAPDENVSIGASADPIIVRLSANEQFPLGAGIRKSGTNQLTVPYCVAVVQTTNKPCAHIQYFQMTIGPKSDANAIIDYSVGAPKTPNETVDQKIARVPVGPVFEGFEFRPENFQSRLSDAAKSYSDKSYKSAHIIWNGVMTAANAAYWISILSTKNQYDQSVPWSMLPNEWKIVAFAGPAVQAAPYLYSMVRRVISGDRKERAAKRMYRAYLKSLDTHENWTLFLPSKKNKVSAADYDQFTYSLNFMFNKATVLK